MLNHRVHLFELHEQPWYPPALRALFQDAMSQAVVMADVYKNVVEEFAWLLDRVAAEAVLDLCSGSGGPVVQVCTKAGGVRKRGGIPRIVLSDLHPNRQRFAYLSNKFDNVSHCARPVDALDVPSDLGLPRVRTMFGALHHFRPEEIGKMLTNATTSADAVAFFESTERTMTAMMAACTIPLTGPLQTALAIRPFRLSQVIFGLCVPIVPLTGFFDALVSNLRSYTPEELENIVRGLDTPHFEWKVGSAPAFGNLTRATYLLGWVRNRGQ